MLRWTTFSGKASSHAYLILLQVGFSLPMHVAAIAVSFYLTFSPLPVLLQAVLLSVPLSVALSKLAPAV
jgi:hypothetical protein